MYISVPKSLDCCQNRDDDDGGPVDWRLSLPAGEERAGGRGVEDGVLGGVVWCGEADLAGGRGLGGVVLGNRRGAG